MESHYIEEAMLSFNKIIENEKFINYFIDKKIIEVSPYSIQTTKIFNYGEFVYLNLKISAAGCSIGSYKVVFDELYKIVETVLKIEEEKYVESLIYQLCDNDEEKKYIIRNLIKSHGIENIEDEIVKNVICMKNKKEVFDYLIKEIKEISQYKIGKLCEDIIYVIK